MDPEAFRRPEVGDTFSAVAFMAAVACILFALSGFFEEGEAKDAVKNVLRDPYSAKFRDVERGRSGVCGFVNSRNGFGAYVGFQSFVFVDGQVFLFPSDTMETAAVCAFDRAIRESGCKSAAEISVLSDEAYHDRCVAGRAS